ncbi:MAG TPA: ABC transporter ATP-binding protein [Methylomusa anaerophila]|uniref:Oligopeptide transport ATP-binding protein OppD n=1 Tax=Methylomusa anaerophila TaxID=1930071 RepID=A0A348ANK3_9FIRM|nr:ABC transporter ATP-binding protein [Methylomusa anaerophila]BBB92651.1 oligopeptide transport ATP-binding protein OppD [Methylomusa anaerophila]HML87496.1 ABC transporter ATP-binding protein [Methylomusa anaerophila]
MEAVLSVENLKVVFNTYAGKVQAVNDVSFTLGKGEVLGIVGESGCGKSVTASSLMGLIPSPPGEIAGGRIMFKGKDIAKMAEKELRSIRGNDISMIFQDPMTSLNPVLTVGLQLGETFMLHQKMSKKQALAKAVDMLRLVGIPAPESRISQYPHQMSGGMRQRVMIAMALACNPKVLIADEPTTALDVTIQAQIMDLMKNLNRQLATSIILITHDLGVVAGICHRVMVMYAGKIVEMAPLKELYANPQHPYTWSLLRSVPRLDVKKSCLESIAGQPPDLLAPPPGCAFMPRCRFAMEICKQPPELAAIGPAHTCRCWLVNESSPYTPASLFKEGEPA